MPSKEYTLKELFIMKLQALYDIEQEIIKALPKMAKKAFHPELKVALEEHLAETQTQKTRLEDIFEQMGEKPKKLKVEAIRGIVEDANWVIQNIEGNEARDAAMLASAQYVEHYEMAGYGTAIEWVKLLEMDEAVSLLEETLEEEKAADEKLSDLAESEINEALGV